MTPKTPVRARSQLHRATNQRLGSTVTARAAADVLREGRTASRVGIAPLVDGPRETRPVTILTQVAASVDEHVERGAAASFSEAMTHAAFQWASNQDLRVMLDEVYDEDPGARPSQADVDRAATELGLA